MNRTIKLSEIARLTGGELQGTDCDISGISDLENQQPGTIAYAENKKSSEALSSSAVAALIINRGLSTAKPCVVVDHAKLAFSKVLEYFSPYKPYPAGVCTGAHIEVSAVLGANVSVQPGAVIMNNSRIGDGTVIYPNVYIGRDVVIGRNCVIKAGVAVDDGTVLGDNVIIHHNAVIGGDGFGYIQKDGRNIKIPQIGRIIIGNDVEIGACSCVDRAMIGDTVIGDGVKIDNLVQVAHNVKLGENTILVSQVGIAGSTTLGKNCILAGQVGVADHISIGDNVVIMAQSGVEEKKVESGRVLFGYPARDFMETKRIFAAEARLPELLKRVAELEKKLGGGNAGN